MAGSEQQKLKLLYLYKIFNENSDEDNPLTANKLIDALKTYGIKAERKSVYSDIRLLEEFGLDICKSDSKKRGSFIGSRVFDLAELRLLIDAVQSAQFITKKKTNELIKKIEGFASKNESKSLNSQIYIDDRIKCQNEEIYYNIDKIHSAIISKKKVTFQYYNYNLDKEKQLKNSGKLYKISPYTMIWFDDHYYLVGNNEKYDNISHYRIDRMCNVFLINENARDFSEVSNYHNFFNTGDYSKKLYNMFSGIAERVKIKFKNNLINTVIDKFGSDISIFKEEDDSFSIITELVISDGFISWLFLFGDEVKVIYPEKLILLIKEKIKKLNNIYNSNMQ